MPTADLVYQFLGIDAGAGASFDRMAGKTLGLGRASSTAEKAIKRLVVGAGVLGTVIGVESVKAAANFQTALTKIHTQADASNKTVATLRKGILDMTAAVATSPENLANAAFHIASVGQKSLTTAQQLRILKIAAEGAKLGGADLVDVTNALDAAVVSGIRGVKNYSQAMGVLNSTVGAGDMTMQNLAEAFGPLGAVLRGYNISIQQAGAALATFGDNNLRGAFAGTQLRMAVQALAVPVKTGRELLQSWGVKAGSLANQLRHGGLTSALDTLYRLLKKNGVSSRDVGTFLTQAFGKRAGIGLSILIGQLDRFHKKLGEVNKGATGFAASWKGYTQTFQYNWDQMRAAVERLLIEIGTKLLPTATRFVNYITTSIVPAMKGLADWFDRNSGIIKYLVKEVVILWGAWKVYSIWVKASAIANGLFAGSAVTATGAAAAEAGAVGGLSLSLVTLTSRLKLAGAAGLSFLGIMNLVKNPRSLGFPMGFNNDLVNPGGSKIGYIDKNGNYYNNLSDVQSGVTQPSSYAPGMRRVSAPGSQAPSGGHHKGGGGGKYTLPGGGGPLPTPGGGSGSAAVNALHITAARLTRALATGLLKGWQGFSLTVEDSLSVGTRHLLNALGKQFASIQDRLVKLVQDAKTKLHNALRDERQFVSQMMSDASLSNVPTVASGYTGNPDRLTNIGAFLGREAKSYAQFHRALRRLSHMGLSKGLFNQIAAMGPTQGLQYAQQIISGQAGSISQLNAYQKQISSSAQALGHDRYGAQIAADRKEIRRQTHLQERMERHLASLAKDVGREVAHHLGPALAKGLTGKQTGLSPHEAKVLERDLRRLNRQLGK